VHYKHRHLFLDILSERLVKALGIFVATWLLGAAGFWIIGRYYGVNDRLVLPDGSLDHANYGFLNCLYLAGMTVSTLGFADLAMLNRVPGQGRDVMYAFMTAYALTSYLLVVYATAQIVSYVIEGALARYLEKRRMERDLSTINEHYVVCGLGQTGIHIVEELVKMDAEVVGMDIDQANVDVCRRGFPAALLFCGDCTLDENLSRAGVNRAVGVFCAVPEDKDNIITVLTSRQLNPNARIVARAQNLHNISKLKQVGASATISPNHIGGLRMASEMLRPSAVTFLDTMLRSASSTVRFENVVLRPGGPGAGKTLRELDVQRQMGVLVVGTVKRSGAIVYNPSAETLLEDGDAVIVICSPSQRQGLEQYLNG
jgi:voltage-gated potassium channel